ncbi:hypothetical protein [Thermoleptolyngbya sp. M55_K2018_002]|uniref:hypothetical protein n=1 Tax=Thermoleptolyngbya sp. M55_K2018_002 TaxID=2747808 RepID=UPI0019DBE396|nr:hypothetical protein [Thermoleptolyngbya sp. M55_K2018_002]HIK42158.1 hypothetical protein [Thermoleptolyngbya sp. M55_K2018_002]
MAKYFYTGPLSAVTLPSGPEETPKTVLLHPNTTVELPADWDYTKTLLEFKILSPVAEPASAPKSTPRKEKEGA